MSHFNVSKICWFLVVLMCKASFLNSFVSLCLWHVCQTWLKHYFKKILTPWITQGNGRYHVPKRCCNVLVITMHNWKWNVASTFLALNKIPFNEAIPWLCWCICILGAKGPCVVHRNVKHTICQPRHECHFKGLPWELERKTQKHEMQIRG